MSPAAPSTAGGVPHALPALAAGTASLRGVAGGLGARTGVDPVLLRISFVVLALAGGAGVLLYGIGLVVSDEPGEDEDPPARPLDLQQAAAVSLVALGVLLMLRSLGLWFGDALVWPALLAGHRLGGHLDPGRPRRGPPPRRRPPRPDRARARGRPAGSSSARP